MLGSSADIYTIIAFTVDQSDQVMVIFTSDDLSVQVEELKIYQDYLINVADKEDNLNTKILNDISVELYDVETFNAAFRKYSKIIENLILTKRLW